VVLEAVNSLQHDVSNGEDNQRLLAICTKLLTDIRSQGKVKNQTKTGPNQKNGAIPNGEVKTLTDTRKGSQELRR
jgi:hypothetical protein